VLRLNNFKLENILKHGYKLYRSIISEVNKTRPLGVVKD